MIRLAYLTGRWIGIEIDSIDDDMENIEIFLAEGTPIMLVEDANDAQRCFPDKMIEVIGKEEE